MALLEEGNPATELGEHAWSYLDAAAYLATLHERSSEVTELKTRQPKTDDQSRRLVPALVAALVVVIVGVAILIASQSEEDAPIVTEPTPTTVADAAPTTEPAPETTLDPQLQDALRVATAFYAAGASGDVDVMQSHVLLDGHTVSILGMASVEQPESEIAWREAVGWSTEVDECVLTNPDVRNTSITCHATHRNAISDALGVGPYWGRQHLKVLYEGDTKLGTLIDTTIVSQGFEIEFATTAFRTEVGDPFLAWLEANHPEDVEKMIDFTASAGVVRAVLFSDGVPVLTPESIGLWRQHTAEFVAEQS
jgi:hypothetical protein